MMKNRQASRTSHRISSSTVVRTHFEDHSGKRKNCQASRTSHPFAVSRPECQSGPNLDLLSRTQQHGQSTLFKICINKTWQPKNQSRTASSFPEIPLPRSNFPFVAT
ncbi:hypothetical protein AVEN_15910-1 [Araneus ventricosus]|uniref:Uncharacterized protein n=1 Tax=Araneus ventricosus TaxID=182803 RepID=A0A4Y2QX95_ARAVE|nr:hypothetical protein AVEN_15910-1 [Araneus ventricosus]